MKNKVTWLILSFLVVLSMILVSCTSQETSTSETTTQPVATITKTSTTATSTSPATTTAPPTSSPAATAANWWDKLGEPQYGGTINVREGSFESPTFDTWNPFGFTYMYYLEGFTMPSWSVDREEWLHVCGEIPEKYLDGVLAESWELTDPLTITIRLRQGIYWWDKAPVNGRELTAEDVQYSYDRMLGTGSGFTEPNALVAPRMNLERVVAIDKYTAVFTLKVAGFLAMKDLLMDTAVPVAREWVEQGDTQNALKAVGTGPFIPTDFAVGSHLTLSRNPDYWGYDERHPQNQLPYLDSFKMLAVPDVATALAALRTGKLDMIVDPRGSITIQQAQNLAKTDPEIKQFTWPAPSMEVDLRCDTAPFTEINVRKALQLAVNTKMMAKSLYGGIVDGIPCGVAHPVPFKDLITPYEEWPQQLKDEYSYNPTKAIELLAEAGYPNGFQTNCYASSEATEMLQAVKAYFMDIGVNMEIRAMDGMALRQFAAAGKHDQMVWGGNGCGGLSANYVMVLRTSTKFLQDSWVHNNDPKYDEIYAKWESAATEEEAKPYFKEADLYILQQHWAVQMFPLVCPIAYQPYIKGYSGEFWGQALFRGYYGARVWVDQDLKTSMGR